MPCPCPYILCFTFIRSSLCEVCLSLTFWVLLWWAEHPNSCWNRYRYRSRWNHRKNIENLSDDPMIAKYWKSLVIQWSWWWSVHCRCRLGGPASTNQNQEFLASNQLEDLVSPNTENISDDPMIAMMIIALRIGRSSIASNHTTAATGGQQIHHCECYNVLSSSSLSTTLSSSSPLGQSHPTAGKA